jgi:hypothetical protein
MIRKNLPLIVGVILTVILFLKGAEALRSTFLPAWPGYGSREYIRFDAPVIALTHIRVIDGTGARPIDDANLVISNGKIQAIGNAATALVPQSAEVSTRKLLKTIGRFVRLRMSTGTLHSGRCC